MAEVVPIINASIQVATLGKQIITLARGVYKVADRRTALEDTLCSYHRRLEKRVAWFRDCNANDVQQAREAHEVARLLVDEARGALGHVQGLQDDSSSSLSRIWNMIKSYNALDIKSLENARVKFDKALYDLDMKILNLKLYLSWLVSC